MQDVQKRQYDAEKIPGMGKSVNEIVPIKKAFRFIARGYLSAPKMLRGLMNLVRG